MLVQFVLGVAHAVVFGVFLMAAAGKLAVCRPGNRAMCTKGAVDGTLALLAGLTAVPYGALLAAAAAIAIGAGGWLREKISGNTVCNCFGVLTSVLHPWRNGARALLLAGGVLQLTLQALGHAADARAWSGVSLGLAALIAVSALAFARSPMLRRVSPASHKTLDKPAPGTISPSTVVGTDANGRQLAVGDLIQPGAPLVLLLTSPGCKACQQLKSQLDPLLPRMPLPVFTVIQAQAEAAPASQLFDPHGQWRRTLGVKSLPALVVIDAAATGLDYRVAISDAEIFALFLRLLLVTPGQLGPAAPEPAHRPAQMMAVSP